MKLTHTSDYRTRRVNAYPEIADQLDAVYKLAKALETQGITLPAATQEWVSEIDSIKTSFPKDQAS